MAVIAPALNATAAAIRARVRLRSGLTRRQMEERQRAGIRVPREWRKLLAPSLYGLLKETRARSRAPRQK